MFPIKSPDKHVSCIHGVIRPLYLIGRLIGFFPFSVQIQMNGKRSKVYFTLIDFIVFVIHATLYGSLAFINVQHNFMASPSVSPLLIFGTRSLMVFGILNGLLCIFADLFNRFKIFEIFDRCQLFDCQVISVSLEYIFHCIVTFLFKFYSDESARIRTKLQAH